MYEEIRESMDSDNAAETVSAEPEVEISTLPENHESNENTEDAPESCYLPPEAQEKRQKWSAFVEGPAVDFFTGYKLEKMTIDDGSGNKAKFSRTKDDGIKVEYTSSVLL